MVVGGPKWGRYQSKQAEMFDFEIYAYYPKEKQSYIGIKPEIACRYSLIIISLINII